MEKAEWSSEAGQLMIQINRHVLASEEAFTDFVIETMVRTGQPYAADRPECLGQIGQRFEERGVETTLAVTDDDRVRYGAAAEAYVRTYFPDLFEDGGELLQRIEATLAEVRNQLEDIDRWAAGREQGPYTEGKARSLARLRDRLQKIVDAILPRPEERKPILEEIDAEVREDDLGLPARVADARQP